MTEYAHVTNLPSPNTESNILKIARYDNFDAVAVAHKFGLGKDVRIIPVERLADPLIANPLTERYGPDVTLVESARVTKQRTVTPIPQIEQDDVTERDQVKALYQALKTGTATNNQVQRVLARLLREQYGE